jgi:hypothetical protein
MKLETLADVRKLIDHRPKANRAKTLCGMSPSSYMMHRAAGLFATLKCHCGA